MSTNSYRKQFFNKLKLICFANADMVSSIATEY